MHNLLITAVKYNTEILSRKFFFGVTVIVLINLDEFWISHLKRNTKTAKHLQCSFVSPWESFRLGGLHLVFDSRHDHIWVHISLTLQFMLYVSFFKALILLNSLDSPLKTDLRSLGLSVSENTYRHACSSLKWHLEIIVTLKKETLQAINKTAARQSILIFAWYLID